jgi:hypothetical protein
MVALTGRKVSERGFGPGGVGSLNKLISDIDAKTLLVKSTNKKENTIKRFIEFVFLSLNNFN